MSRRKSNELFFDAITIEGGLISPEQVTKVAQTERTSKVAEDYGCPKGTRLGDEIARYFLIGQALWREFSKIVDPSIEQTHRFVGELLREVFGFSDLRGPIEHSREGRRYRLGFEALAGRIPVVVAPAQPDGSGFYFSRPEFGDGPNGGRAKRSPVVLLQDWLNENPDFYWGLAFVGDRVRLMRDNASLTRAAWIEADLGAMFRDEMFADFSAWWLLAQVTRFGKPGAPPSECPLEKWREAGLEGGTAARDRLRDGVEIALAELGQGAFDTTPLLKERLETGELPTEAFFEELLRVVYRLIFLAVTEERGLLHSRGATQGARALYAFGYGFAFWRERSARRSAVDGHQDAWEAMKVVFRGLDRGQDLLGLPALGGLFSSSATPNLDGAAIPNRNFLKALYRLSFLTENGQRTRINWRDMKTEELGSVYESLLEIRPRISPNGQFTLDSGARGNKRKTTGSYYTPDSLVETLLDSALDPILDKAELQGGADAILDLKVIDPACGSGHFLLGAARRMADRVAELRDPDAPDRQAALRDVVARCVHGVDRNPMAVELAKVALWIESVSPGQPLGFLDANIRCGDALLGVFDLAVLEEGIPDDAYKPLTGDAKEAAAWYKAKNRNEKKGQGSFDFDSGTGAMPPKRLAANLSTIRRMPEKTVGQVEKKREAFEAWRNDPDRRATRVACDFYTAAFLLPKLEVPENYQRGPVPTTADVWKRLGGGQVYGQLEAAAVDVSEEARAFHWPLAFPDVLIGKGGFDVVLGNPPWERIKLQEQEFFAGHEVADAPNAAARTKAIAKLAQAEEGSSSRLLYEAFQTAKRIAEATSAFARVPGENGGRYVYTGTGDVNTYALFSEHFLSLLGECGRAGILVPTGIATDATTAPFFSYLVSGGRLISLYSAYEVRQWFKGTDDRKSFCLMTIGCAELAEFVFNFVEISDLEDERRRFTLSPDDITRINPNSKTAPVFRASEDARLTAKIYDRVPVLIDEAKGLAGNPWGVSFMRMFDMSNDSNLFRTAAQLNADGFTRDGADWVAPPAAQSLGPGLLTGGGDPSHVNLTIEGDASPEVRYVPLYEAKMVHHFDHRWASYADIGGGENSREVTAAEKQDASFEAIPRYWVRDKNVAERLSAKGWTRSWLMGWRDISLSSVERTTIGSVIPLSGVGHPFPLYWVDQSLPHAVCLNANLSSLALDFVARQKVGGTHLTYGYLTQFPILPPSAYSHDDRAFIVSRVLELTYTSHSMAPFARDLGYEGEPFRWDEDRRAQLRAELDAWYALAYGLSRDELRYVLDPKDVMGEDYPSETFRVLQNNEMKKYGGYRTRRLVLAAYDAQVAAGARPRVEGYR